MQDNISYMEARSPANGARLVARAWVDPNFKELLLSDGKAAASELGMDPEHPAEFIVVENTPELHNLIVCTLCSCYPRAILGRPPDWYKSFAYRSRAVREPRAVMREFGFEPPEGVEVVVHDSTADARYMVLPMRPPGTEDMREEELAGARHARLPGRGQRAAFIAFQHAPADASRLSASQLGFTET